MRTLRIAHLHYCSSDIKELHPLLCFLFCWQRRGDCVFDRTIPARAIPVTLTFAETLAFEPIHTKGKVVDITINYSPALV